MVHFAAQNTQPETADSTAQRHTPGPWRQEDGSRGDGINIIGQGGFYVGLAWGGFRDMEANARLIAAAPDLLEACRLALPSNLCVTNPVVSDSTVVSLDATMGDLRKIAAAIAKATRVADSASPGPSGDEGASDTLSAAAGSLGDGEG